jgi:spermidine/putrescine transport system substrate-binding protein
MAAWLKGFAEGGVTRREFVARAAALGVAASTLGTMLAACGGDDKTGSAPQAMDTTLPASLAFYNWTEYTSPAVMKKFEKEHGVKVKLELYDSNEELQKNVEKGGVYDVIVPEDAYVTIFARAGLLRPLDMSLIPNFDRYVIGDLFKKPSFDPGTGGKKYSVPYMFGTVGFAVRLDAIPDPANSWDLIYDDKYRGGISMLEGAHEVLGPALMSLGCSYNSTDQDELDEATAKAIGQKPLVTTYSSSAMAKRITSGLPLVECWDGDATLAMNKIGISKIRYVLPDEGYNVWMDGVCVPRNAPNPYAAHLFLDFLLDPVNAAASANYIGYQPVVQDADPMVKSLVQRALRPTPEVISRGTLAADLGDFEDAFQAAYAKVKAA